MITFKKVLTTYLVFFVICILFVNVDFVANLFDIEYQYRTSGWAAVGAACLSVFDLALESLLGD